MTRLDDLLPSKARTLVLVVFATGTLSTVAALAWQPPPRSAEILAFLALTIVASFARVPLPYLGSLSLAYALVLAGMMRFGLGTSTLGAFLGAAVTSLMSGERKPWPRSFSRAAFNTGLVSLSATAAGVAYLALGGTAGSVDPLRDLLPILAYSIVFSIVNLGLVSIALEVVDTARVRTLRVNFIWSVPGFLAGSSLAIFLALFLEQDRLVLLLLAAPFAYLVHLAYRSRAEALVEERRHSEQTAALYRSVTEALALAIEAKDENTEEHLRRVQHLSMGIGEALGLSVAELEALRAASLLHDIGKIAVPEHILTKPGRLTALEVEKVRVHPRIGADILAAVPFPYPLAPVVRHHHERWDGTGYPDGLRGEAIPLGARILAVVDCYDALTSDRPYRKALLKEEALAFLGQEAGRMFDPAVVQALIVNVDRLETPGVTRAGQPGSSARFRPSPDRTASGREATYSPSRRTEVIEEIRHLRETARVAGHQLGLEETLTLFSASLARLIPFQTLVVYLFDSDRRFLVARFATGTAADRLRGFVVPVGEKLSGWVAVHERPFSGRAHATPLERDGSRSDLEDLFHDPEIAELRSSLLVPLVTETDSLGVIALYDTESGSYDEEQERLLVLLAGSLARAVLSALQRETSHSGGMTDPWTGVPNSRFFFLEAEQRIASATERTPGMGVLAFRMEGFEEIENTYGETAAERLATATARRLSSSCLEGESVARFAPDLFVVLTKEGRYQHLRDRLAALGRACQAESVELRLGVSGEVRIASALASYPRDGSSAEGLLDRLEAGLSHRHIAPKRGAVVPFEPMRLRE